MSAEPFRSFTHPVTNFAELSSGDAQSQLAGLMQVRLPELTWSTLAHELTHHWCFNTPVGIALTHLYLRPIIDYLDNNGAMVETKESTSIRYNSGVDLVTYDMVMGLLFPIIEGMALFTEFDVVPHRQGDVYSLPLHWTAMLYVNPDAGEDIDSAVFRFLLSQRTSQPLVRRKAGVLAQPLRTTREGYLAGYLLVKNLWVTLAGRDERLWESDVFLRFIHSYVFGDMGLVARILESPNELHDRYAAVAATFNASWSHLVEIDVAHLAPMVDEVINAQGSGLDGDAYFMWSDLASQRAALELQACFWRDSQLCKQGINNLLHAQKELYELATPGNAHFALQWMFTQRDAFCVMHEAVRILVTRSRRLVALLRGNPIFAAPEVDGFDLAQGEYDGSVSGYILPGLDATFVALAIDGRIGAMGISRDLKEFGPQLRHYRMDTPEVLASLEVLRQHARAHVMGDPTVAIIAAGLQQSIKDWHQRIAEQALPYVDEMRRATALRILDGSGFAQVAGSAARLRALAAISLLASFPLSRQHIASLYEHTRGAHACTESLDDVINAIQSGGSELLNDPLIVEWGAGLLCFA